MRRYIHLLAGDDTPTYTDDWYGENYDQTVDYQQIVSASIAAAVAWNVLVVTLEINDFRHRLKSVFMSIDESVERTQRYVASLVAIRLGLRDALIDWALLYAVGYSFVAGFTYHDADPNSVYVIWGVSIMVSAGVTGTMALKVPQWLGSFRKCMSGETLFCVKKLSLIKSFFQSPQHNFRYCRIHPPWP